MFRSLRPKLTLATVMQCIKGRISSRGEDLAERPYELVPVAEGWMMRARPAYGAAIRVAADIGDQEPGLSEFEVAVLAVIACSQPVTRDGLARIFGRSPIFRIRSN
jgi:chromosome segregation and condensation protein ScpB